MNIKNELKNETKFIIDDLDIIILILYNTKNRFSV